MAVSRIVSNYTALLNALAQYAASQEKAAKLGLPPKYFAPSGWNGDVFDIPALGLSFSRRELYGLFRTAVSSADAGGTVGDLETIVLQGDFLAAAERAFRARHASSVRDKMHAAGRHRGQGDPRGVLTSGLNNFLKSLVKLSAG